MDGVIPRSDPDAYAERFGRAVDHTGGAETECGAVETAGADEVGVVGEDVTAGGYVDGGGFRVGFAGVEGFDCGEMGSAEAEEVCGAVEDEGA